MTAVYAWYRPGRAVYVSRADSLHERTRKSHKGQSASMGTSAFRRNVAEIADIGSLTMLSRTTKADPPLCLTRPRVRPGAP